MFRRASSFSLNQFSTSTYLFIPGEPPWFFIKQENIPAFDVFQPIRIVVAQVGCCSDLLPYFSHKLFCNVILKSLSFSPEDVTTAFLFYTFLFFISSEQICKQLLVTLFWFIYRLNWVKFFQYCTPFCFLFLSWTGDWFIFSWNDWFFFNRSFTL